jgi:hypothetical protein
VTSDQSQDYTGTVQAFEIGSAPAVTWNSTAGQFQIAVRGTDDAIYVGTATASGIVNNGWVQIQTPGGTTVSPAIAWNSATGRLQIVIKGKRDNSVYVADVSADIAEFSGWTRLPSGKTTVSPAITCNPETGKVQIAVKGNRDNSIYVADASADGTGFSGWTRLPSGKTSASPAITWNPETGKVQIAVKGNKDSGIYVADVSADGTGVSGWTRLPSGGDTSVSPAITWNPETGKVQIAVKGKKDSSIYVADVNADGTVFGGWIKLPGLVSVDSPAIAIGSVVGALNIFVRDATDDIVGYAVSLNP